jgi:hypothetical protein
MFNFLFTALKLWLLHEHNYFVTFQFIMYTLFFVLFFPKKILLIHILTNLQVLFFKTIYSYVTVILYKNIYCFIYYTLLN